MIASLNGTIVSATPPTLVLECNGVGYEVWMPASTFASLPEVGSTVRVHTSLVVRDDSHQLYGFLEARDRVIFLSLIRVSGIGAKSALALLSALDATDLAQAVESGNVKMLIRAPGIGRKNAERLIVELRGNPILSDVPIETPVLSQAVEALIALGYPASQARTAMAGLDSPGTDVASLVKQGLAKLSESVKK